MGKFRAKGFLGWADKGRNLVKAAPFYIDVVGRHAFWACNQFKFWMLYHPAIHASYTMADSRLFQPLKIGNVTLQHRIALAPLTRQRGDETHVPLPFVKEYYAQRASAPGTLLISEGTYVSARAGGIPFVPGIWNEAQIGAWREVTDTIHQKGCHVFMQLWTLGRSAAPEEAEKEGWEIKSASAIPKPEEGAPVPQELTKEEIRSYVQEYTQAARNAIKAGFDGVELHYANGYLVDQFLQDMSNQRTDEYGGSIENRSRFAVEIATAVVDAIGSDKVGVRFSPWSEFQGMRMKDPVPQFTDVITKLSAKKLAYLHLVESRVCGHLDAAGTETLDFAIRAWGGVSPVLLAGGYTPEKAKAVVDKERADQEIVVSFGRSFLATPDLPFRIRHGLPLTPSDRSKLYNHGEKFGYLDWPFSKEFEQSVKKELV